MTAGSRTNTDTSRRIDNADSSAAAADDVTRTECTR